MEQAIHEWYGKKYTKEQFNELRNKCYQKQRINKYVNNIVDPVFITITMTDKEQKMTFGNYMRRLKNHLSEHGITKGVFVSDYGGTTGRKHLHGFISLNDLWASKLKPYRFYKDKNGKGCIEFNGVEWDFNGVDYGYLTIRIKEDIYNGIEEDTDNQQRQVNYMTKYMNKDLNGNIVNGKHRLYTFNMATIKKTKSWQKLKHYSHAYIYFKNQVKNKEEWEYLKAVYMEDFYKQLKKNKRSCKDFDIKFMVKNYAMKYEEWEKNIQHAEVIIRYKLPIKDYMLYMKNYSKRRSEIINKSIIKNGAMETLGATYTERLYKSNNLKAEKKEYIEDLQYQERLKNSGEE